MGLCQGCSKVFSVIHMKDGYCKECYEKEYGTTFSTGEEDNSKTLSEGSELDKVEPNGENTYAVLSVVFGVFGILLLSFIFGPLGLFFGLKSQKNEGKSTLATVGIVISSIVSVLGLLALIGGMVSISSLLLN